MIIYLRNVLYDVGIFKSHSFSVPIISVGNIAVGGTGKTPHVEYLVRLLKDQYKVAVLSRGYKRNTSGYFLAENISDASEIGDEPCQIKQKFPDIQVAVCENRVEGVKNLIKGFPDLDIVLLDDAFQHRQIKPGLSLLLIDYNSLFKNRMLLPAGDLREPFIAKKRADILIVTKTPEVISDKEKENILKKLKPHKGQKVFYSYIEYGLLTNCFEKNRSYSNS
ncbi:MAG: tetraacyldisaccharide 4'-kinase [Bacteroidia bacterium]|nr:tetraacyldisaccharide 4'-kinase [Bacteroidia bacterium]